MYSNCEAGNETLHGIVIIPILFLIMINGIRNILDMGRRLFADELWKRMRHLGRGVKEIARKNK